MYAIRNIITGQWLCGTDFRQYPYIQKKSDKQAILFEDMEEVEYQFKKRECNTGQYEIVKVKLQIVGD